MEPFPDKAAELRNAKSDFRKLMLANDTFYALLTSHFAMSELTAETVDPGLPIFQIEPTVFTGRDHLPQTTWAIGVRIANSLRRTSSETGAEQELSELDYMTFGFLDTTNGGFGLSEEMKALIQAAGIEEDSPEVVGVFQDWIRGVQQLQASVPNLVRNSVTLTFELPGLQGIAVLAGTDPVNLIGRREAFVSQYFTERGWNPAAPTVEQVIEVRGQPEWQDPPEIS